MSVLRDFDPTSTNDFTNICKTICTKRKVQISLCYVVATSTTVRYIKVFTFWEEHPIIPLKHTLYTNTLH